MEGFGITYGEEIEAIEERGARVPGIEKVRTLSATHRHE